jgi:salicylate hydroxylase
MVTPDTRVAIIGGGIGGLTLALALRERGVAADVYEAATELSEIGAAVALSANGTRELARLGVGSRLAAVATEPTELIFRHWRDGTRIAAHPVGAGGAYRRRCEAPYFGIHRADLQRILGDAVGADALHLDHRLEQLTEEGDGIRLEFRGGRVVHADVVVAADGIRSTVRRWVSGEDGTAYSGTSGFRGIAPVGMLPTLPDPQGIQFWMGPGAHLLHYAIGGAAEAVNFLAVVEGPPTWDAPEWQADVDPEERMSAFAGWHPAVTEMLTAVPPGKRWALFAVRPVRRWHRGRVVLLGDAAHGMLPHHGQGANTTIEDAVTLAVLLAAADPADLTDVLGAYQRVRRARTRAIQRSSWVTSDLLHLPDGPAAAVRDEKVRHFPQDFAWIHTYDARAAAAAVEGLTNS